MIDPELQTAIEHAWSAETASADNRWSADNPAAGHCDVTSLVVRERVGGGLRSCRVFRNGEFSEHHYWNVLPDGREIDLTRSQFDGRETFGEVTTLTEAFLAEAGPMNPLLVDRVERYRAAVVEALARPR
ncbi:MAG: YunG family protein [Acidimicrobiales bacterium]